MSSSAANDAILTSRRQSMATIEAKTVYTPEDLLTMPEGKHFELVDGKLVERNVGSFSSFVGGGLFARLREHCDAKKLGWVWPPTTGFQCFPDSPGNVRRPSVAFI